MFTAEEKFKSILSKAHSMGRENAREAALKTLENCDVFETCINEGFAIAISPVNSEFATFLLENDFGEESGFNKSKFVKIRPNLRGNARLSFCVSREYVKGFINVIDEFRLKNVETDFALCS